MTSRESARAPRILGFVAMLAGALILGSELLEDWVPHDEGALGQAAERVLQGEVPHRDFGEIYTGLLTYVHAAVFRVLPISSASMRVPLFIAAMAWMWATWRILLRFVPQGWATVLAVTAMVWSVPNYPAPMPSWYILFCATFAALALLRWLEEPRSRFLVLAGLFGGLAFLFKLHGLFVLLGAGLALLTLPGRWPSVGQRGGGHAVARVSGATAAAAALLLVAVVSAGLREFVRFAVPTAALLGAVAFRALRPSGRDETPGWGEMGARLLPFLLGGLIPVAAYLLAQAAMGALPAFLEGVFVAPFRRTVFAFHRPPSPIFLVFFLPLAAALTARFHGIARRLLVGLGSVWFATVVVLSGSSPVLYQFGWSSAWGLLFFVAGAGAWLILGEVDECREPARAAAIVVTCIAVALTLLEYPYAPPIYVIYGFPLTLVATVSVVRLTDRVPSGLQAVLAAFFLGFGFFRVMPLPLGPKGMEAGPVEETAELGIPRGGIRVPVSEAAEFRELVALVNQAADGRALWAGPDSPEVYFFSGVPNHTRVMFEFLEDGGNGDRFTPPDLVSSAVGVAVVNLAPDFSAAPSAAAVDSIRQSFTFERRIGDYLILWK